VQVGGVVTPVIVKVGADGATAFDGTVMVPVKTRVAPGKAVDTLAETPKIGVTGATVVVLEDWVADTEL